VLSAHQGGGEPLQPLPLEITRYLRVPGAEPDPPPHLIDSIHQSLGFVIPGKEGKVLRLRKTLYGFRQAPMAWNARLDSTLNGMGFGQSPHEAAIYRRGNGGNTLLVGVYVNDLVITDIKDAKVVAFKEDMNATFQMSDLEPLSFYLGIKVH
jgi:hypothetical protein